MEFLTLVENTDKELNRPGAVQSRPLEPMYPVVFFDALRLKVREDAVVRKSPLGWTCITLHMRRTLYSCAWRWMNAYLTRTVWQSTRRLFLGYRAPRSRA